MQIRDGIFKKVNRRLVLKLIVCKYGSFVVILEYVDNGHGHDFSLLSDFACHSVFFIIPITMNFAKAGHDFLHNHVSGICSGF